MLHATYVGYHGDAFDWLTDNPELTVELLNRCGYWYFLHQVKLPSPLLIGEKNIITMVWENRGVAPAYWPYALKVRLVSPQTVDFELDSGNQKWISVSTDGIHREEYSVAIPEGTPPGQYDLKIKLYSKDENKDVFLALDPDLLDAENYYKIAAVTVAE